MAHAVPAATPAPSAPRIEPRQWLTLAVVLCGTFMAVFDVFVVNVAVPSMQRTLHATFAQVQFVIAGYSLAYAVFLITGGRLGDIYGRKRLFMLGMTGFVLTSALCGLAPAPWLLVGARIMQGLAAAAMTPQVLSTIQVTFVPEVRGRALAAFGAAVAITAPAGQVLGGLLIRANLFGLSWRPIFLINLPIGVGALIAAAFLLTESRSATAPRLDWGGVCLVSIGLFLLAFPLVEGRDAGWPRWAWLCLLASVPTLAAFVGYERWKTARDGSPLLVLRLFRQRAFVAGILVSLLQNASNSHIFALTLYLQLGLHYSPLAAGLILAPAGVGFLCAASVSVKLLRRLGNRLITYALMSSSITVLTIAALVFFNEESLPRLLLGLAFGITGFTVGSTLPPLLGAVLAGIDRNDAGSASGVFVTCQQIGGAMGVAIIGVIFFGVMAGHATRVSGALAPDLAHQLAATSLSTEQIAMTVGDFRSCADDRARSHDPAISPASCQRPTLDPPDPAVRAIVGAVLQRATAGNYANAYVISVLAAVGFLLVALVGAFNLPARRDPVSR